MQPGSKFSLAGALFDWPVGEGCANPTEHAPDSWRTAFESCADAEVWLGLFRSCSSSRDWAWRTAPSASVVLDCTVSGRTQAARQQHFQAVQQCLSVRGALPTKLTVACDQDLTRDSSALTAVSGVGAGIVSIHVRSKGLHSMPREGPAAVLLQGLALACPNTTSIALTHVMCQLPPPSKFPHVTELVIRPVPPKPLHPTHDTPTDWPSKIPTGIVAYAGQLTSLHLDAPDEYWTQFFSRPNPVPKLTHFSTSNMSKQLVGSLCEHARALRQVTSGSSSLGWAQGEWCVDTIVLVGAIGNDTFASMPARRDGGRLVVSAPALRLTVCAEQGLEPRVVASFSNVSVSVEFYEVTAMCSKEKHATALRNAMQQLGSLHVETAARRVCVLSGWALTDEVLSVVADMTPTLADTGFGWCGLQALTSQQLSSLLRVGPRLCRLSVYSLSLQSDQHANTPWPWDELTVLQCDAAMLLRLPNPGGEGTFRVVRCETLLMNAEHVTEASVAQLCSRLQHIQFGTKDVWTSTSHSCKGEELHFTCACSLNHQGTDDLKRLLTVLRAVRLSDSAQQRGVTVILERWCLTPQMVAVLANLPRWRGRLVVMDCDWDGITEEVAEQLVCAIPQGYVVTSRGSSPYHVWIALCKRG